MFQNDKKPFTSDQEQHYYRVSLTLAGLFYVVQFLTEKSTETTQEFLIPRIVMGIIPILLASLSFVPGLLRNKLQDLSAGYFMIASLHVLGLLSINDSGPGDIFIIFGIIFFTNLQLTRMLQIVIYNITMLASIEYVFITSGFGSGIDPVAFFLMLVLVILMCGAYQIFRIRSAGTGKDREHLLSELVSGNPDAWIVFEGNGLIAREAGSRAMELFGLNDTNALRTFSLRNIITAGSPFEADKIISSILAGERVEQKTMCRKPSGELFWAEIAVYRISVKEDEYFCRFIDISEYLNSKEIANATAIRYRSYLDNINEGLIIADQHLKVILANRSASELTGTSQFNGHSLEQVFREEVMMRLWNLLTSTESSPAPFETLAELKNGQKIKVTVSVETEPVDQTRELVILLRKDIPELQEPSGQQTPEEWKNFLSVLGKGQIPACAINQKGHFILCNRAFSQTTGYGPGDLSLLTLDNIVHPSDTDKVALILKGQASKAVEIHLLDGEGRDIWVKVSASAIPAEGLTLLILEDITDLILTRQELQRSGSRIGALIENTQSPVALIDFNHRLTYFNNAFRNEFRKRTGRNAVNGEDYRSLLQDQALERWETAYNKLISGERYFEDEQVQYTDGTKAWFESSCTPVKDQSGAVTGISLFMRNVTDRITFQNDLIQARNQAEAATKAKSGFLATMSHEIRTPLNGLLGMAELLTGTALNNEQKSYLDSIRVSGEALLSIINDVLDYSKIESEMMTLEQKPFSISGTIRETFDMLRYRADEKGNTLSSKTENSLPDIITGDKVRLRQVLLNLTGNAIKFTENGNIAIDVRMLEQTGDILTAEFTVSDTGIGIPPDKMDKLFKSFSQADESTFSQYGGTGLGLAISARLVSLMGGTIRAESIHGKGSKFIFTIKTKAAAILPAEPIPATQKPATTSAIKLNILVAEDNAVNQQVALAMISKMGHAVTLVNNGKEAVDAAMTGKFPVIFMDVQMPVMDGLEATRQIRQRLTGASQPFIVAMTAQALEGDREACLAAGMDDYIAKPVTASAFADKIRSYIKSEKSDTAAETSADTGAGLLDFGIIDKLRALGDDDNAFMSKIIQLYQDQSTETMEEIKRNAEAGDMKLLYQSAHKLKGASLNLGAKETGEWCRKLEEASKASDIATCHEIIPPLERTFSETIDALKKLI